MAKPSKPPKALVTGVTCPACGHHRAERTTHGEKAGMLLCLTCGHRWKSGA